MRVEDPEREGERDADQGRYLLPLFVLLPRAGNQQQDWGGGGGDSGGGDGGGVGGAASLDYICFIHVVDSHVISVHVHWSMASCSV